MPEPVFHRTPAGVANYPQFYNVEYIFFCEGESSQTHLVSNVGIDEIFWTAIIKERLGLSDYKLLPVGPKSQVVERLSLAVHAQFSKIDPKVYGCIDRDYDDLQACYYAEPFSSKLLSTNGYSVENDLLFLCGIPELCARIAPRASKLARHHFEHKFSKLVRLLTHVATIDRFSTRCGLKLFSKEGIPPFLNVGDLGSHLSNCSIAKNFHEHRKSVLKLSGVQSYSCMKARYPLCPSGGEILRGILDFPGKSLLKCLALLANSIFSKTASWSKLSGDRILNCLLAEYQSSRGTSSRATWASSRPLSWNSVQQA